MKRHIVVTGVSLVLLGVVVACSSHAEGACKVDTECPQGSICRDERCGPVGPDAGAVAPPDAGATTCTTDGLLCGTADECCSRACTDGRCGASTPSPPDPAACRGLYELCQNDCCQGLTCVSGACR